MAERVLDVVTDRLAEMVAAVLARTGRPPSPSTRLLAGMLLGIAHHGVATARRDPGAAPRHAQRLATDLALSGLRHMPAELLDAELPASGACRLEGCDVATSVATVLNHR